MYPKPYPVPAVPHSTPSIQVDQTFPPQHASEIAGSTARFSQGPNGAVRWPPMDESQPILRTRPFLSSHACAIINMRRLVREWKISEAQAVASACKGGLPVQAGSERQVVGHVRSRGTISEDFLSKLSLVLCSICNNGAFVSRSRRLQGILSRYLKVQSLY